MFNQYLSKYLTNILTSIGKIFEGILEIFFINISWIPMGLYYIGSYNLIVKGGNYAVIAKPSIN